MNHWATRVARSTALSVTAEVLSRGANTIFFILLTWFIGEADAGRYSLGFVYSLLILPFAFGGFDQLLIRESARNATIAPRLLGNLLLARLIGVVFCYLALLTWLSFDDGYDLYTRLVIAIIAATALPESLINLYQGQLFAFERVSYITLIGSVTGAAKLIVGVIALMLGGTALIAALVVLASSVLALILHSITVARVIGVPNCTPDWSLWRTYMRPASAFFVVAILITLEGVLDALLLSRFYGPVAVGTYSAATNLIIALNILPSSFRQAILPVMTRTYALSKEQAVHIVAQSLRLLLTATLLISISLTVAQEYFLPILYRDHFQSAGPVFVLLVWAFVFTSCAIPNARLIVVAGHQDMFVPLYVVSLIMNVLLNLWWQPWLGVEGAALARLASALLIFLVGVIYVQVRILQWPVAQVLRGPLLAAAGMLIIMIILEYTHISMVIILGGGWLTYGMLLWGLRVFCPNDLRWLRHMIRRETAPETV